MYAIHRIHPDLAQVVLPAPPGVGLPFGRPGAVWVLGRGPWTLVDSGHVATSPVLAEALRELGVAPCAVDRVLLTGSRPEQAGGVSLFPNAAVFAHTSNLDVQTIDVRDEAMELGAEVLAIAEALQQMPGRPDAWGDARPQEAIDAWLAGAGRVPVVPVRDGVIVQTAAGAFECIAAPGISRHGCVWFDHHARRLIGGHAITPDVDPWPVAPMQYADAFGRIAQLRPAELLPGFGAWRAIAEDASGRGYVMVFRSMSLQINNLIQNMPYAFDGPMSAVDVARADLGFLPRDLVRFAASVHRFRAVLDDLVLAGAFGREEGGIFARYLVGSTGRGRSRLF